MPIGTRSIALFHRPAPVNPNAAGLNIILACALAAAVPASAAELGFDTQIVSLDLRGTVSMPFGPGGGYVETQVAMAPTQDYNGTRSNRSAGGLAPPNDPIDPDGLDGTTFNLFSVIDLQFVLTFVDVDPNADFDEAIADNPTARTVTPAVLSLDQPASFVFDKDAPDFGMLRAGGPPKKHTHRGHVTVLKIAFGGGGGGGNALNDIELDVGGLVWEAIEGSDKYTPMGDGTLQHGFGIVADLSGTYNGNPFFKENALSGTMVERGALTNTLVPTPQAAPAAAVALLALGRRSPSRRRR